MKKLIILTLLIFNIKTFAAGFTIESTAFQNNTRIPKEYTCKGSDYSPPLTWKNYPQNTQSFVLIMDDLYKQNNNRVHWILFNIPATVIHLDKNTSLPDNAISAHNSWSKTGYKGPCPLNGIHPYIFTLYALDTRLTVNSNSNKSDILNAMQNHVLGTTTLIGLYE